MNRRDLISMGVRNLFKRKLRTFLTILGVTIGTASIVVMVSLGLAVNAQFAAQIENMTDLTLIEIYNYSGNYFMTDGFGNTTSGETKAIQLNDDTIAEIQELPGVIVATPILRGQLYLKSGNYYMYAYSCMGLKPEAMQLLGYNIEEGRLLQDGDGKTEVVFGHFAEKSFENSKSSVWIDRFYPAMQGEETETYVDIWKDKIRMSPDSRYINSEDDPSVELDPDDVNAPKPIKPYEINVVGLLESKPNDWNAQQGIFFDINALKELMEEEKVASASAQQEWGHFSARKGGSDTTYETAYVKCEDLESTIAVNETLVEMGFQTYAPVDNVNSMQEMTRTLQILLAAIGGVSLFVAAIGIANTMVMSIYERTREIGVMKVIGAAIRDIKWLFLLESAMIGFFGGALGLGLSFLISYIMNNTDVASVFGGMIYMPPSEDGSSPGVSLITPWLCGVAMGFSSVIGLMSGYFPARRAMKLSALSAIRTE